MRRLKVYDFSCIQHADIQFAQLTVLIGPQASGKSVLSKLSYFFIGLLEDQNTVAEEGKPLESFKAFIRDKFREWFPITAWGPQKFCIDFEAGPFQIRLMRVEYRRKLSTNIRVTLSSAFEQHYKSLHVFYLDAAKKRLASGTTDDYELLWRMREFSEKGLRKTVGDERWPQKCGQSAK